MTSISSNMGMSMEMLSLNIYLGNQLPGVIVAMVAADPLVSHVDTKCHSSFTKCSIRHFV